MPKTTKKRVTKEKELNVKPKKNANSITKPKKEGKGKGKKEEKEKLEAQRAGGDVPSTEQDKTMEVPKTKEVNVDHQEVVITDVNMENIKIEPSKTFVIKPFDDKEVCEEKDDISG